MFEKFKREFCMSIIFSFIMSISILFIPITDVFSENVGKIMFYVIGVVFWLSLVVSQVFFWIANRERRLLANKLSKKEIEKLNTNRVGLFETFQNRKATIADSIAILSLLLVAVALIFKIKNEWIILISVSLLIFSFNMHCIFNGVNYRYIHYISKLQKEKTKDEEFKG